MTEDKKAETFRGVKAFKLLKDGRLQTGEIGGSVKTFFKEGETYSVSDEKEIKLCSHGFHFYKEGNACFGINLFGENTVFHEVIVYGNVILDTEKCVAKTIKIGKKITPKLDGHNNSGYRNSGNKNSGYFNTGDCNSGNSNSGDYNSGNYNSEHDNSGDRNSGERNSGNSNSGNLNSGDYNSGRYNSGDDNSGNSNSGNRNSGHSNSGDSNSGSYNSGERNSGRYNSGDFNSGDWNSGDKNSGSFNTEELKLIIIFNKPCELKIWQNTKKPNFLYFSIKKNETYKEAFIRSWEDTTKSDRKLVEKLPNFNWEIFTEISGITKPIE